MGFSYTISDSHDDIYESNKFVLREQQRFRYVQPCLGPKIREKVSGLKNRQEIQISLRPLLLNRPILTQQ